MMEFSESAGTGHAILESLPAGLRAHAAGQAQRLSLEAGQIVFRAGDHCQGLPLILSGSVRVEMTGLSGSRIVLYRMGSNDICTLSIGCLMTGHGYRAEAYVEEPSEAVLIPRPTFERLMDESRDFRLAIMASYGRRLDDLMLLVEEVAFRRMDQRLDEWLVRHGGKGSVAITHQELAGELGTAREVVSRLLKELERKGQVRLARGRIDVVSVKKPSD
ncbi:MAG TPA: Crp/Fnr family transcriptional regulator [Marinobacter sp.]